MDKKETVRRFVEEAVNGGSDDLVEEPFTSEAIAHVREWFGAFRRSFPDMRMKLVELVEEDDIVAGRFACSATHLGAWRGHAATGRRFEDVDEVYFFTFSGERIATVWDIEDNARPLPAARARPERRLTDGSARVNGCFARDWPEPLICCCRSRSRPPRSGCALAERSDWLLAALVLFTALGIAPSQLATLRARPLRLAALVLVPFGLLAPLAWAISRLFADPVREGVLALGVSSSEVAAVGLVALAGGSAVLALGAVTGSLVVSAIAGPPCSASSPAARTWRLVSSWAASPSSS